MSLQKWRKERFVDPPSPTTVRAWAEAGEIPVKRIGGKWYVEIDVEKSQTGDPLVDEILQSDLKS